MSHASEPARNGHEYFRRLADESRLVFRRQRQVSIALRLRGQRSESPAPDAEVGQTAVRALFHAFEGQRNPSKICRIHLTRLLYESYDTSERAQNMGTEEERCAKAKQFRQIDEAFRNGDLDALRAAVNDPAAIPNGRMPETIGSCLVYAIYHSPLAFIRTLLETGADPNAPVDDGFPPLIAALSRRESSSRTDTSEILRLLLKFGANPNQRGINDYTPLHMAVAARDARAARILLDAGANPELPTRIDDRETPLEMEAAAGLSAIRRRLRSGLYLLADMPGTGDLVRRRHDYRIRIRLWLNRGEAVRWSTAAAPLGAVALEDDGETLITEIRIDRRSLVNGLFHGIEGMRIGGTRRLEIAPHLAYGGQGVPGVIPAGAVLIAEVSILEERGGAPDRP
jgi:uncharacterized protein